MSARRGIPSAASVMRARGADIWRNDPRFRPPTDVFEREDVLCVRVEVAGMRREDFHIVLEAEQLTIQGRRERKEEHGTAYHQVEVGYGDFEVAVRLPFEVRLDAVRAAYEEGMLLVELPRRYDDERRVIQVPVQSGAGDPESAESSST